VRPGADWPAWGATHAPVSQGPDAVLVLPTDRELNPRTSAPGGWLHSARPRTRVVHDAYDFNQFTFDGV